MPISLSPKITRRYSPSAIVSAVPTVGPRSEYIPPRTTANTMRSETPMPARVSGFTYVMYWAYATPPIAVRPAESIVIPILNRVTCMPTDVGGLVLADRLLRLPRHRPVHTVPDPEPGEPEDQRGVIEDALVGELHGEQAVARRSPERETEGAAGPVA